MGWSAAQSGSATPGMGGSAAQSGSATAGMGGSAAQSGSATPGMGGSAAQSGSATAGMGGEIIGPGSRPPGLGERPTGVGWRLRGPRRGDARLGWRLRVTDTGRRPMEFTPTQFVALLLPEMAPPPVGACGPGAWAHSRVACWMGFSIVSESNATTPTWSLRERISTVVMDGGRGLVRRSNRW